MNEKNKYVVSVILSMFIGAIATLLVVYYIPEEEEKEMKVITEQVTITESDTIAPAVDKVYDSVVTVSNYQNSLAGLGTGFVYKTDDNYGYILTNNHVVEDAKKLTVTNTQDVTVDATLLGKDEYADLAVLRVEKSFVTQVAELGDSTNLRIGDTIFTVGTPVSTTYAGSVTKGIVSGKNRTVSVTIESGNDFMMDVLQITAPINPGNSGGPLVNINGQVVGINTLKLVQDKIEGMGFSIPIEMATTVLDRLEKGEKIERPLLGIGLIDANNTYSLFTYQIYLDKDYEDGIVVVTVEDKSTASEAGFKKGDVILKIDGIQIKDRAHFKYLLYKYNIGDTVTIEYERDGQILTTKATLNNAL